MSPPINDVWSIFNTMGLLIWTSQWGDVHPSFRTSSHVHKKGRALLGLLIFSSTSSPQYFDFEQESLAAHVSYWFCFEKYSRQNRRPRGMLGCFTTSYAVWIPRLMSKKFFWIWFDYFGIFLIGQRKIFNKSLLSDILENGSPDFFYFFIFYFLFFTGCGWVLLIRNFWLKMTFCYRSHSLLKLSSVLGFG